MAVHIKRKIVSKEIKSPEEILFLAIELAKKNLRDFRPMGENVFDFISNRIRGKDISPYTVDSGDLKHALGRIGRLLKAIISISSFLNAKMIADTTIELEKKVLEMV